jgi:hypothetical protein
MAPWWAGACLLLVVALAAASGPVPIRTEDDVQRLVSTRPCTMRSCHSQPHGPSHHARRRCARRRARSSSASGSCTRRPPSRGQHTQPPASEARGRTRASWRPDSSSAGSSTRRTKPRRRPAPRSALCSRTPRRQRTSSARPSRRKTSRREERRPRRGRRNERRSRSQPDAGGHSRPTRGAPRAACRRQASIVVSGSLHTRLLTISAQCGRSGAKRD